MQDPDNRDAARWPPHLLLNAILTRWVSAATFKVHAGRNRQQSDSDMELGSVRPDSTPFLNEETSGPSSLRSSLDNDYYRSQACDIHIYDDVILEQSTTPAGSSRESDASAWHGGLGNREELMQHLKVVSLRSKIVDTKLTSGRLEIRARLDGCRHPHSHGYIRTNTQLAAAMWWDGPVACWM